MSVNFFSPSFIGLSLASARILMLSYILFVFLLGQSNNISMLLNRFAGDVTELGIIRAGEYMKVNIVLNPRVHLVRQSALGLLARFLGLTVF